MGAGNVFLPKFLERFNEKFSVHAVPLIFPKSLDIGAQVEVLVGLIIERRSKVCLGEQS
jgi:hypothetical protein